MKKLIQQVLVLIGTIGYAGALSATSLTDLLVPGASLQVGDKVFDNFGWSSTSISPSGINVTTIGDGTPNNLYGIDIQGSFAQLGVGSKVGQLTYAVHTIGNYLISDIHQFVNVNGRGQLNASVLEVVSSNPSGIPVEAQSTVGTNSITGADFTDPPAELGDVLILTTPLPMAWISKTISVSASNSSSFALISDIQQRFSQLVLVPRPNPPTCVVIPASAAICAGDSQSFTNTPSDGTPPYSISWTGPNGFTATGTNITIINAQAANAGTYTATVTDSQGSNTTCFAVLTVNPLPTVSVNSATICGCGSAMLTVTTDAGPGATYLWNNGATSASITVSPTTTTTYTVVVTSAAGCSSSASGTVTFNPSTLNLTVPPGGGLGCNPAEPTDDTVAAQVIAMDTCGAVTTNITHQDLTTGCIITRTFTVLVTNACLNSATGTVVYTWTIDTTPPVVTAPTGTVPLGCNPDPSTIPDDAAVTGLVQASDNCSLLSTNVTHVDGGTVCAPTRTFTIVVADGCQNKTTNTVVYTWTTDTTPPVVTAPTGTVPLGCNPNLSTIPDDAAVTGLVQASDNCSLLSTNVTHVDGGTLCAPTRTFTIVVADGCQNKTTNTVVYTWTTDTTPPVVTAPTGTVPLGCNPDPSTIPDDAAVTGLVLASDNCSLLSTNVTHVDGGTLCAPTRTFTIVVADGCQNKATNTVVYAWTTDTAPPVVTAPTGTVPLGCNPDPSTIPDDAAVTGLVLASDNCSLLSTNVTHVDGGTLCAPTRTFTIVVADGCQNKATNTVVYAWTTDTAPPVVTAPTGTVPLGCNPDPSTIPDDAAVTGLVLASDNCSLLSTNVTHVDGGTVCAPMRTFTIVVADGCQNKTTNTVVYTWTTDTTPPVVTAPTGTVPLGCNPDPSTIPNDAAVVGLVQASDDCSLLSTNVTHVDGGTLCAPTRTFTIVVADGCQNKTTNTVVYTWTTDTTPPVVTAPTGTVPLGCNPDPSTIPDDAAVTGLVQASDNCSLLSTNVTHVDGGTVCAPTRTFTIVVADGCQNKTTNTVVYTWTTDTTPPVVTAPTGTVPLGCNPDPSTIPDDAAVTGSVRASDNCSLLSTNVTHVDGGTVCAPTRTFTIVVADGCQNKTTNTVVYTWTTDTTPPVVTAPTGTVPLGCNPNPSTIPNDALVAGLVQASDNCSLLSTNVTHVDGGTVCAPTRTFTIVVADGCQNKTTNTVVYTWTTDTTPPVVTAPVGTVPLGCNPNPSTIPNDAAVAGLVQANDNCSLLSTNVTHVDGGTLCAPTRTFTIVVADGCQNKTTNTVVYTWTADTTPPAITVPTGSNLGCNPANLPTDASVKAQVTASDTCSAVTTNVTHVDTTNSCTVTRTFTVTVADVCNNSSNKTVVYTWTADTTPPVIACPANITLQCNQSSDPTNTGKATATGNCVGNATVTYNDVLTPQPRRFGSDNKCVIEAEHYDTETPGTGHDWTLRPVSGDCSGDGYVEATVHNGTICSDTSGPRLDYRVTFPSAGTWYVWVRGQSPDTTANSCHIGLDGTKVVDNMCNASDWTGSTWTWANYYCNGLTTHRAQIVVSSAGDHTLNVWMCKDGLQIDKILLCGTPDDPSGVTCAANGQGPGETPKGSVIVRTWTATDACGNSSTCTQTITRTVDNTPPVITCPPDKTVQCADSTDPSNTGTATATDLCSIPVIITYKDAVNPSRCFGSDNRCVIEAEHFDCGSSGVGHAWTPRAPNTNCSGDGYVEAATHNNTSCSDLSGPRMDYRVKFPTAGTWYVWLRGQAPDTTANSCHIGLDGVKVVDNMGNGGDWSGSTWKWANYCHGESTQAQTRAQIVVGAAGDHTLNLWMCKDGLQVDKIMLCATPDDPPQITCGSTASGAGETPPGGGTNTGSTIVRTWIATDASGNAATCSQRIQVLPCPSTLALACQSSTGQVGLAFTSALVASGGTPPYTNYAIISGSLPPGLALNAATGVITGTPSTAGTFSFTARVKDSKGATATAICTAGCSPGSVLSWSFLAPTGTLATAQAYTVGGITLTAYGFDNSGVPIALYGKNLGGDENGLGINLAKDNEIATTNFIQLDIGQLIAGGAVSAEMWIGSVQPGEGYDIYGSGTLGTLGTKLVAGGTLDGTLFPVPSFGSYRYLGVRASAENVLLGALSATLGGPCSITITPACSATISGLVVRDCNADGLNLTSDPGLAGVTVTLKNAGGTVLAAIAPNASGAYTFGNLAAGTYTVVVTPPPNYLQTADPDATKDSKTTVTLAACQTVTGVNFGYTGLSPSISLKQTVSAAVAACGQVITYTFAVTNTGNTCFYGGMHVDDPLLGGRIFYQTPVSPGQGFLIITNYTVQSTDPVSLVNLATATGHPPTLAAVSVSTTTTVSVVLAPASLTAKPGNASVSLGWSAVAGAAGYNVKRSMTSGGPYSIIKGGQTTTTCSDATAVNGTPYFYVVSAVKSGLESCNSAQACAIPSAGCPSPWSTKDIGAVAAAGGASYSSPTFTVVGSGADIWGTADEFRYVYQPASGDCSVVAKVLTVQNTDPWAKAGVMIRESLNANAQHAATFLTPGNGVAFQYRNGTGASSANVNTTGFAAAYWVKIVRAGNLFSSYRSPDGTTWTLVGSQTIYMSSSVYIGLVVCSHLDGTLCPATFNSVTATP